MTVYKDKKTKLYRYDIMIRGQRFTGSGYKTIKAAQTASELHRVRAMKDLTGEGLTFGDLVDRFLAMSKRTKSEEWTYQLKRKLNKRFAHLAKILVVDLKPAHFDTALASMHAEGHSGSYVNEYRKIAHSVMNYAVSLDLIPKSPIGNIKKARELKAESRVVNDADLKKLLLGAAPDFRDILVFITQTGARISEVRRLRWTEVFEGPEPFCLLTTRKRSGGGEHKEPVPLTPAAALAIRNRLPERRPWVFLQRNGRPLTNRAALKRLERLCERVGVARIGFHAIRHWVGTKAVGTGISKKAVGDYLRHKDTGATERYLHATKPEHWAIARMLEEHVNAMLPEEDSHNDSHARAEK